LLEATPDDGLGVGVHTSECRGGPDGYRGVAVEAAIRLAAAARPGTILITRTVHDLTTERPYPTSPHPPVADGETPWEVVALTPPR
jgi:class 3 adenylate cyclase